MAGVRRPVDRASIESVPKPVKAPGGNRLLLTLAVDTTTNRGGFALARDGRLIEEASGDAGSTHGERLPGALRALLGRRGMTTADVDRYAVALGPGSFTGLRVGIATVQGLALAHGRLVVGMPVLDVLVDIAARAADAGAAPDLIVPWVDAKRGEVFSALYECGPAAAGAVSAPAGAGWRVAEAPVSAAPAAVLDGWAPRLRGRSAWVIGDGVAAGRPLLDARLGPGSRCFDEIPSLAAAMAAMAVQAPVARPARARRTPSGRCTCAGPTRNSRANGVGDALRASASSRVNIRAIGKLISSRDSFTCHRKSTSFDSPTRNARSVDRRSASSRGAIRRYGGRRFS